MNIFEHLRLGLPPIENIDTRRQGNTTTFQAYSHDVGNKLMNNWATYLCTARKEMLPNWDGDPEEAVVLTDGWRVLGLTDIQGEKVLVPYVKA